MKRVVASVIAASLLLAPVAVAAPKTDQTSASPADIVKLRKDLAALSQQIDALAQSGKSDPNEVADIKTRLAAAEAKLSGHEGRITSAEARLGDAAVVIAALTARVQALEKTLPSPPAPEPTVSATLLPNTVVAGGPTTYSWAGSNLVEANPCTLSGLLSGPRPASGSQTFVPGATGTVGISCKGLNGNVAAAAPANVTVTSPPPPALTLDLTGPSTAQVNVPFTLSWRSNADQCEFGGAGAGIYGGTGSHQFSVAGEGDATFSLACTLGAQAAEKQVTVHVPPPVLPPVGPPPDPVLSVDNSAGLTISNQSGTVLKDYPVMVGMPGLMSEFSGYPQALINGTAVPTQADRKNQRRDRSWQFGVVSFRVPELPATGAIKVTFENQGAPNNTAASLTELLQAFPAADAAIEYTRPATLSGIVDADMTASKWQDAFWTKMAVTDGAIAFAVDGKPYEVTGINLSGQPSLIYMAGTIRAAIAAKKLPLDLLWAADAGKVFAFGGKTIELRKPSGGTDLGPLLFKTVVTSDPVTVTSTSARQMMQDGKCWNWTSGPISTQIVCGDHVGKSYDLGVWGNAKPIRPLFNVTFWTGTDQVDIEATSEMVDTTKLQSQWYNVRVLLGTAKQEAYKQELVTQPLATRWTRRFHIGTPVEQRVNIAHNRAHLVDAAVVGLYDPTVVVPEDAIATSWAAWQNADKSIGGAGFHTLGMGATGQRPAIGSIPGETKRWLDSGDWRAREIALTMSELQDTFPALIREGDKARKMDRAQLIPAIGQPEWPFARPTLWGLDIRGPGSAADALNNLDPQTYYWSNNLLLGNGWAPDVAHLPDYHTIAYALTGSYGYLDRLKLWTTIAANTGAPGSCSFCRGPGIALQGQVRGQAWALRNMVNAWYMIPDNDTMKQVVRDGILDAIAWWEGAHLIDVGPDGKVVQGAAYFAGTPMYLDGRQVAGPSATPSPLHWWDQATGYSISGPSYDASVACSAASHWMNNYMIAELGEMVRKGITEGTKLFAWAGQNIVWQSTAKDYNPWTQGQYVIPNSMWVADAAGVKTCVPLDTPASTMRAWSADVRNTRNYDDIAYPGMLDNYFAQAMAAGATVAEVLSLPDVWASYQAIIDAHASTTRPDVNGKPTAQAPVVYQWGRDARWRKVPRSVWHPPVR